MSGRVLLVKMFILLGLCLVCINVTSNPAWSQTPATETDIEIPKPFTENFIQSEIEKIQNKSDLTEEAKSGLTDVYDAALKRLLEGEEENINAANFKSKREFAPQEIAELENRIQSIRDQLNDPGWNPLADYQDLTLEQLEVQLAEKVAEATNLRNAKAVDENLRSTLAQRPGLARTELADARERVGQLTTQLAAAKTEGLTDLERASNLRVQATLFALQHKVRSLEQELASNQPQLNVVDKRLTLRDVQILQTEDIVRELQIATGSARTMNAEQQLIDAEQALENVEGRHPYVRQYAQENIDLLTKLRELVEGQENIPASEARIRTELARVRADEIVTQQIIANNTASRSYGVHLRQLRQKQPPLNAIRTNITERSKKLEDALFQRIVNQEALQAFYAESVSFNNDFTQFEAERRKNSEAPVVFQEVTPQDIEAIRTLRDFRRDYLNELASFSAQHAAKLEEVNALEKNLLTQLRELCELLDGRLLWLPSTEAIGFDWPGKLVTGFVQSFTPTNAGLAWRSVERGFRNNYFVALIAIVLAGVFVVIRERLEKIVSSMSKRVGRVQQDSYILTPVAILDGLLKVAPWALVPLALALIVWGGSRGDDISIGLTKYLFALSALIMLFLTIREWSRKNALFDLHFRVDTELRHRIIRHVPWFVVVQAIGLALIGLTRGNFDYYSGQAAVGVLGFLFLSLSIAMMAIKLYWSRPNVKRGNFTEHDGIYVRNEKWFFALALILPVATAIMACVGYYESARLLLMRLFLSFCVLMLAYVIHGFMKRSVVIAQRRLALEQAKKRRDQALKARTEKAAAEERGEVVMPKLDYEQIDLETINRQSSQLVNISVVLAAAAALWGLWASLVPALSILNDVELPFGNYDILGPDGENIHHSFTLWNLVQAIAIGFITWLAGRNLPGFLDVFILKRLKFQQSTRFAITTVVGYIIFIVGALIVFDVMGIQWSKLQWIVAALGVGIGFGLQEIIANFISGLIILFERPVRIGDYVSIGENSGTVTRIQIRATTLIDLDNKEILIPNKALVTERVTNWTLTNPVTRLKIDVGVAYGSDTELTHKTILETVKANKNVLSNPEPTVLFLGFGDSSLDFQIRVFLRDFAQRFMVSHELHMAIDQALREVDIEIPFPQRDLHIKNPDMKIVHEEKPKPRK
ncbi:MAG: mechanosensitive ion channel, partial [Acidimicrobiales bacterium]